MFRINYKTPAEKRMQELCTNGLFLNLSAYPQPLQMNYQQLKELFRDLRFGGAAAALADLGSTCLHFPMSLLLAHVAASEAQPAEKQQVYRYINDPFTLRFCLAGFFRNHPSELAGAFLPVFSDACSVFLSGSFAGWKDRDPSGILAELVREDYASELVAAIGQANEHLQRSEEAYRLLSVPVTRPLRYQYRKTQVAASPFLELTSGDFYLAEGADPLTGHLLMRSMRTHRLRVAAIPPDFSGITFEKPASAPDDDTLTAHLNSSALYGQYIRPAFWDRWLLEGLSRKHKGYLVLEADEGMGKSVYCSLLDPSSPYYDANPQFEGVTFARYRIQLYPDTQRPSIFTEALNRLHPSDQKLEFIASAPDMRRRIAVFLNRWAKEIAPQKLVLLIDGISHLEYEPGVFGLYEILPQASALSENIYLLLTQRPEAHFHQAALEKDTDPWFGRFSLSYGPYQELLRVYLTQYVLHTPNPDDASAAALSQLLNGNFAALHLLKDLFPVCRNKSDLDLIGFYKEHPGQEELLRLYLDRLRDLYSSVYSNQFDCLLELFLLSPHPLSLADLQWGALDRPESLWMLIHDLRPFLTLYDADHLAFSSSAVHYALLSYYSGDWRLYASRLLDLRGRLLTGVDFSRCAGSHELSVRICDLDYYANAVGWVGNESILSTLAQALLPVLNTKQPVPSAVIDFFQQVYRFFPDNSRNPFLLDSLDLISLSDDLSDRSWALNYWDSLRETPYFVYTSYEKAEKQYQELLCSQDPLSFETIEKLTELRRQTRILYEDSFLWHTSRLRGNALKQALRQQIFPNDPADPCNLPLVRETLEQSLRCINSVCAHYAALPVKKAISELQQCALTSNILLPFLEAYLRALLPVLCDRDLTEAAGLLFDELRDYLLQLYAARKQLSQAVLAVSVHPDPDRDYRKKLYLSDSNELHRAELLKGSPRQWLRSFPEKQQLQFFTDPAVSLWQTEEAFLRLDSRRVPPLRDQLFSPRGIQEQLNQSDPKAGLAICENWYCYALASLCSSRAPVPSSSANGLCEIELSRARFLAALGNYSALHASLLQLFFYIRYGELSTRRLIELNQQIGELMLKDPYGEYSSSDDLKSLYFLASVTLSKARVFLTGSQMNSAREDLKVLFPGCLRVNQFYPAYMEVSSRQYAAENPLDSCREKMIHEPDPVQAAAFMQAYALLEPDKAHLPGKILPHLEERIFALDLEKDEVLADDLISYARLLNSGTSFSGLYEKMWKNHIDVPFPQICLSSREKRLLTDRVVSAYLSSKTEPEIALLYQRVMRREPDPHTQAFTLLCLSVHMGTIDIASAWWLAGQGLSLLSDAPEDRILGLELSRIRVLALCMDERLPAEELEIAAQQLRFYARKLEQQPSLPLYSYASFWNSPFCRSFPKESSLDGFLLLPPAFPLSSPGK